MANEFYQCLNETDSQLEPEEGLLWAILHSALKDKDHKFLNGIGLKMVCRGLNLDYRYIKRRIKA